MTEGEKQGGVFPAAPTDGFTAVRNVTRESVQIKDFDDANQLIYNV
jgi:hypothetical protein